MNNFWKYFLTVVLALIGLNIVLKIIGITLHFLFPILILAGIIFLLYKLWSGDNRKNHKNSRDPYEY
ncbi:hypothetical protein ACYRFS_10100 [Listeria kieliensis]|uniref:Uncharacterized protein n=1 Tax=Listeria kieliensis TaxID=1621700 RepID=A0A3D8TLB9_9LIST|nr:hypothetical protein [Listeria kieliensis]RDW99577.1 hypothetical protein UR08_12210 [Listeria kieliensis]